MGYLLRAHWGLACVAGVEIGRAREKGKEHLRLQNSPYFCVFKYARAVKQKVCNEAENRELKTESVRACEARALRARKTLTPRFTDFFTDFEKKTDCFAV